MGTFKEKLKHEIEVKEKEKEALLDKQRSIKQTLTDDEVNIRKLGTDIRRLKNKLLRMEEDVKKNELFIQHGVEKNPLADALYNYCNNEYHAYGRDEVNQKFMDLVDMIKPIGELEKFYRTMAVNNVSIDDCLNEIARILFKAKETII